MTQRREYWVKVLRWDHVRVWAEDAEEAKDLALDKVPGVLQVAEEMPRQVPEWQTNGEIGSTNDPA